VRLFLFLKRSAHCDFLNNSKKNERRNCYIFFNNAVQLYCLGTFGEGQFGIGLSFGGFGDLEE